MWLVRCDCGNETKVSSSDLKSTHSRSCGCLSVELLRERSIKHGLSKTRTYQAWENMCERCRNPARVAYRNIGVCARWLVFENFRADMGDCPDGLTLDRIDVCLGYEPGNCRWTTYSVQGHNKRPAGRSVYAGVSFDNRRAKWKAAIQRDHKRHHLGSFNTELEAHNAYLAACTWLYPEDQPALKDAA